MTCKRRSLALLAALLVCLSLDSISANSLPTQKNPQPSVTIDEPGARKKVQSASGSMVSEQRGREPPGSPVNLFMPDEFQFYTLNNNGQLVMKQMTKQEIQGMIAAGGTGLPVDLGHQQTKVPEGEPKVADVVQNVQKVLKGELNKPVPVHTSGSSSIPGSVNSQWTNMLPYILSGGSVDQQDIAQDTSMILPTLDDQSSYVDVVPLQNGKPLDDSYEPTNYVQVPAARPTLLGNMALDSGILGEQEAYTTKRRPSRPTTTYPKFTTTRPTLDDNKNSSKPTLYIPLSVSPSLLADSQNKDNYDNLDINRVPVYAAKPSQQNSAEFLTTKKTTSYVYFDDVGFTRLPMVQVPVIEADKLSTSSQQKTPVFEILPTISPVTTSSTTLKDPYPSKVNIGPMGGFKKPSTGQRPTTSYRPIYEPITYRPIYEPSSRRPVYEPGTKVTTQYPSTFTTAKASTTSLHELVTKPTTLTLESKVTKNPETTIKLPTTPSSVDSSSKISDKETGTTAAIVDTTFKLPERTTDQTSDKVLFTIEPIKVEDDSDTTTAAYYTTEKFLQKQTVKMEEPTTNEVQYTTYAQKDTTREPEISATSNDSYEPIATNKPAILNKGTYYFEVTRATDKPSTTNKFEQTPSWTDSETTVQFVPVEETTLYQPSKYEEVTYVKESTAAAPIESSTTFKTEYPDLSVGSTTKFNVQSESTEKEYEIPTVPPMLSEAISSIIGSIESKPLFYESVTYDVLDETTIENKMDSIELTTEYAASDTKSTLPEYKETVPTVKPLIKLSTPAISSATELQQQKTEPSKLAETTAQKIDTATQSAFFASKKKTGAPAIKESGQKIKEKPSLATTESYIKKQETLQEQEVSTVKVIPIYDDDTSIYTMPSDSSTKLINVITTKLPEKEKIETKLPSSISPSTESYTTQSNLAQDTILPGLEEAFNNYIKEHYDPKLATTGNYDDISRMTTFPTIVEKASSSDANKSPILSETESPKLEFTTIVPNYESTELLTKATTVPSKLEEKLESSTQNIVLGETKLPEVSNKNSVETPIIYLDVSSPEPEKEITRDNVISNSSLTRIRISNPVAEADKIISDLPIPTNTPSTVQYTLPIVSRPANNIASGIIAGYPTYSQEKPITDYVSSTESVNASTESVKLKQETKDKIAEKDKIVSYQKVQTTLLPVGSKTSVKPTNIPVTSETTVYKTTETASYESFTQIPFESLPMVKKPSTSPQSVDPMNDPPLEKISDLINQLQNSPADRNSIGYDNSNGIATTIVPLDRFESIMSESSSTTRDEILTTIIDNLSKTTMEPQNSTYVVIQILPSSKLYQTTTESHIQSTTTKKPITQRPTKPSTTISDATTVVTIVKQPVTGRPYVASTYSTTKSSIEKIQSTIDKSAGRINLEEEKTKVPAVRPTEPSKFTMKNKLHYSTLRRPVGDMHQTYTRKTTKPIIRTTTTTTTTPRTTTTSSKPIADSKENDKWTLIPQKVVADQSEELRKVPVNVKESLQPPQTNSQIVTLDHAKGAIGLDQSNKDLDKDVAEFLNMCNELSFRFWTLSNAGLSSTRSVTMSPFGMVSTLAMIFLGARGLTSNAMNDILKLDDVVTFNPHLVFQNITDAVTLARGQGIENAAFVRALFADRLKVRKIMPFYKEQAQQFYEGAVVDINFSTAGDILRRRTNLLIRKQTGGRIKDFVKGHTVPLRSPLTALSANVFQTSCDSTDASSEGRDGEMYFAVSQTVKQRKLVPIPAVVWKSGVSAGYEPSLDATAVALGDPKRPVSLIMVMPGQQGLTAAGDNLEKLEFRLFGNPSDNALEKLLKVIIPRRVELQMPKFSQRSVLNVTSALKRMGFDQLFTKTADLKGINGAGHDLYLAEMIQMNLFCTCGDDNKAGVRHLAETYPGTAPRHTRAWELLNNINNNNSEQSTDSSECDEEDPSEETLEMGDVRQKIQKNRLRWFTSSRRRRCRNKRQAEPERPRMKMDKPFLYLIRHNLSGLILHMGRFNPKNQS